MKIGIISVGYYGTYDFTSLANLPHVVWVYYPSGQSRSFRFENGGLASAFVGKTLKRRKDVNVILRTPCTTEMHDYGGRFPNMLSVRFISLAFVQNFDRYPSSFITTKTK